MKFYLLMALLFIVIVGGIFYIGYNLGLNKNNPVEVTQSKLTFKPPIALNNQSVRSAIMEYSLNVTLGDVTTKNGDNYLALISLDGKLIGDFKIDQHVFIGKSKGGEKNLTVKDIEKGRNADVNVSYNAYKGGGETAYIGYILMK